MMRILVTGASGLLGRAVMKEARKRDLDVVGLCFSRKSSDLKQCNLVVENEIQHVLEDNKPDVVIHCAAERKPDVVEKQPDVARAINVEATTRLCRLTDAIGGVVLYISTDYVMDGNNPPYAVGATPNPLNAYGKSKLEGEKEVLKFSGNVVLRVPLLYGGEEHVQESAVSVLFPKVLDSTKPAPMSHYERRYPTHCGDVAAVIFNYLQLDTRPAGILHWSGSEMMTKYDMAVAMAEVMGVSKDHIEADTTPSTGATRPYDAHLDRSILEGLGCGSDRSFRESIAESVRPFMK